MMTAMGYVLVFCTGAIVCLLAILGVFWYISRPVRLDSEDY